MNPLDVVTQGLRSVFYVWLGLAVAALEGRWTTVAFCIGTALLVERFHLRGR